MSGRLLERDPLSGVSKWMHWNETTGLPYFELRGDNQDHFDYAAAARNNRGHQNLRNDLVPHSHVSPMLEMRLLIEHGLNLSDPDHLPFIMHKIETDPDYQKARVGSHRLMAKEHASKLYFGARKQMTKERHYGCELDKILDGCR